MNGGVMNGGIMNGGVMNRVAIRLWGEYILT